MMAAVANADKETAIKECHRIYTDKKKRKKSMTERNKGTREFIKNGVGWKIAN
jgi:hypothetical protein